MGARTLGTGVGTGTFTVEVDTKTDGEAPAAYLVSGAVGDATAATVTNRGLKVEVDGTPAAATQADGLALPTTIEIAALLKAMDNDNPTLSDILRATGGALHVLLGAGSTVTVANVTPIPVTIDEAITIETDVVLQVGAAAYQTAQAVTMASLNALVYDTYTTASTALTNAEGYLFADVVLKLGTWSSPPAGDGLLYVYILPDVLGDGSFSSVPPTESDLFAIFDVTDDNTQIRHVLNKDIPPGPYKLVAKHNMNGAVLPATGCTLTVRRHN